MSDALVIRADDDQPDQPVILAPRDEAFVAAYVGEARFDAKRAGMAAGMSEVNAAANAYLILRKPEVRARIRDILESHLVSQEAILSELVAVAFAPTTHFMQVLQAEYTDERGRTHDAIIRQDYAAKLKALELLGKNQGMFSEKIDVNISETKTIVGIDIGRVGR